MKTKLLFYLLPVLLIAIMLYGYDTQAKPKDINQSSTNEYLQSSNDNPPFIPPFEMDGPCTYVWTAQVSGTTDPLLSVDAITSKICWAGGGLTPTPARVIRTIDGGATWTNATGAGISGQIFHISAVDKDTAFCTTTPGATFIYKTTNGGTTWLTVFTQAGGFIDGIQMISPSEGYAVGDPVGGVWTFLKTTNAGNTWTQMATAPPQAGTEFGYNNSFHVLGTHIWFGTNNTRVYHSTDLGLTWSSAATTGNLNITAVHFNNLSDGLVGWAVTHKSNNGGTSYTTATHPGVGGAIFAFDGNNADWWALKGGRDTVWRSVNQGTSWTSVYVQTGVSYNAMDLDIESGCAAGWAVGNAGGVSKMAPSEFTKTLQFKAMIEGYVSCSPFRYIGDTLTVEIHNATSPFALVATAKGKNDGNGDLTVSFTAPLGAGPYYIVVRHRNALESWSKSGGEAWPGTTLKYDFTTAASQIFGSNAVLKCGKFCIYSGDVNQDGIIDGGDLSLIDNDAFNFVQGYVPTDINCDNIVDGSDAAIADNNAFNFVGVIRP